MASQTLLELPPTTPRQYGGKKSAPGLIKLSDDEIIPVSNTITVTTTPSPRSPVNSGSKRGASGPIVTTSDEESDGCPSPRTSSQKQQQQNACKGYEHDHDYENVSSPGGSSTASGPVYVRPPGFKYHAQEIKKTKKKKTSETLMEFRAGTGLKKRAPTPPKVRPRREPVPMRLRALPQSFWKQPNVPNQMSPGNCLFPSLPPLYSRETGEDVTDVRPVTPPEEREAKQKKQLLRQPDRKLIVGDTDLLLKHLFAGVAQTEERKTPSQLKRGRPRKMTIPKATSTKALMSGDDPYLVDAVTEKLFPQLTLESRQSGTGTSLQLVTLREGDKCVTLPSLSIEQNYSQMLSELAMNI